MADIFEIGDLVADTRRLRHGDERCGIVIGFKPWRRTTLKEIETCPNLTGDEQAKIEYPEVYWFDSTGVETVMLQDIKNVRAKKVSP